MFGPRPAPWPDAGHVALLQVCLGPDAAASEAFRAWRASTDPARQLDGGTYTLLPTVFWRLSQLGWDHPDMRLFGGVYRKRWAMMQALFGAGGRAIETLEGAGIETMLLRGAPLALAYYPTLATRPLAEIDIAVKRQARGRALAALTTAGWQAAVGQAARPGGGGSRLCDGAGQKIVLHARAMPELPAASAEAWAWRDARAFDLRGHATRLPRPTAALMEALLARLRRGQPRVRWVLDAAMILRERPSEIDWAELTAFAQVQGVVPCLRDGLDYLTAHRFAAPPEAALASLAAAAAPRRRFGALFRGRAMSA